MDLFADRGFVFINGVNWGQLTSAQLTCDLAVNEVDTMTKNNTAAGYNRGNKRISITLDEAIRKQIPALDLALADEDADIRLVFEVGADRYTATDVVLASWGVSTSVGSATKNTSLKALDLVNENGASVNASISLG